MDSIEIDCGEFTVYDDEGVRKKLTVMSKWEAMLDDSRNGSEGCYDVLEDFLQIGESYKIDLKITKVEKWTH